MKSHCSVSRQSGSAEGVVLVIACLVLIAGMLMSIYYPYPSGESLSLFGFIALWLREILILGCAALVVVVMGFAWLRKAVRNAASKNKNAP